MTDRVKLADDEAALRLLAAVFRQTRWDSNGRASLENRIDAGAFLYEVDRELRTYTHGEGRHGKGLGRPHGRRVS